MDKEGGRDRFANLLRRALDKEDPPQHESTYLRLIENGSLSLPSRRKTLKLAEDLDLNPIQTDQLLDSAGHAPRFAEMRGGKPYYRIKTEARKP